jgi:hypothetical protein
MSDHPSPQSWTCTWHLIGQQADIWNQLFFGPQGFIHLRPGQKLTDHECWVLVDVPNQAQPLSMYVLDCLPGERLVLAPYAGDVQGGRLTFEFSRSGLTTEISLKHDWAQADLWHLPDQGMWWDFLKTRHLMLAEADLALADQEIL